MKRGAEQRDNPNFGLGPDSTPEEIAARPKVRAARNAFIAGGLTTAGWTGTALALSQAPITTPILLGSAGIAGLQVATVFGLGYVGYKAVTGITSSFGNLFNRNSEEKKLDEIIDAQNVDGEIQNPAKRARFDEPLVVMTAEDTYNQNKQNLEAQVDELKQNLANSNCKTLFSKLDKIYASAPDAQFKNGNLSGAQPARNKVQFLRWEVKSLTNLSVSEKKAQAGIKSSISRKADAKLEKVSNKRKV